MPPAYNPAESHDAAPASAVLVVEDEVLIRMAVADRLRECGYRVVEAGTGDEAIAVLKTDVRIDVVFTDVTMPGSLDGCGLARWVRRERPRVRVILTSGTARSAEEAADLRVDGPLMAKPYDPVDVERRIRALIAADNREDPN